MSVKVLIKTKKILSKDLGAISNAYQFKITPGSIVHGYDNLTTEPPIYRGLESLANNRIQLYKDNNPTIFDRNQAEVNPVRHGEHVNRGGRIGHPLVLCRNQFSSSISGLLD